MSDSVSRVKDLVSSLTLQELQEIKLFINTLPDPARSKYPELSSEARTAHIAQLHAHIMTLKRERASKSLICEAVDELIYYKIQASAMPSL